MMLKAPVTEIYAPIGARLSPSPRIKWQSTVNLFVRLYPRITSSATGERNKVSLLMKKVVKINSIALRITKAEAAFELIIPLGISLFWVRGLRASNLLSTSLLKPMAAFLAKIMQRITNRSNFKLKLYSTLETASENPIRAKGIAKTVWLNFTSEK